MMGEHKMGCVEICPLRAACDQFGPVAVEPCRTTFIPFSREQHPARALFRAIRRYSIFARKARI